MDSTSTVTTPLLEGHSALIFGAASGIGKCTALAMARHGASKLALCDYNADALDALVELLKASWPQVDAIKTVMDVRKAGQVHEAVAESVSRFGRIDVAVNSAGIIGPQAPLQSVEEDEWQGLLEINLSGVFRCQKEELAVMMKQEDLGARRGRGAIINLASMYGVIAPPATINIDAYTAAKHAVVGLTRAGANAYASHGVRINAMCPGYTATPLLHASNIAEQLGEAVAQHIDTHCPMKRFAAPEEIADALVFLASPMSSFVNGAAVMVDGGMSSN
ncbi:hypothetical protein CDD81_2481 [Ophiocordyceps australis]|uniref:Uncharacterized protein n=1 Tax=Ophiocordyceps australis TaxID=1399860 RepID=A0A2C5Y9J0_9HYPO|nr:hypothetical protein CDD81_2481 [Ophiocordyceps australis]